MNGIEKNKILSVVSANAASYLELGVDMDGYRVPLPDLECELSVGSDSDGRSGAPPTTFGTVDHVAILPARKARLETRVPILIRVVDSHEPGASASERDALGGRREPVRHPVRLDGVPESDHSGDGGPTVLAVPSVCPAVSVAGAVVPVRTALIVVTELVTGQDGGSAPGMSQDPDVSEGVDVARGAGGQSLEITFRIVVGDECVGTDAGAGRVPQGFGVLKRRDSVLFERELESESVLEGLSLTEPDIFSGSDLSSSTIVNLRWIVVSKVGMYREMDQVRTS